MLGRQQGRIDRWNVALFFVSMATCWLQVISVLLRDLTKDLFYLSLGFSAGSCTLTIFPEIFCALIVLVPPISAVSFAFPFLPGVMMACSYFLRFLVAARFTSPSYP
jgi:hypothetical protein